MQSQRSNSAQAADDLERLKLRVRRSSSIPVPKEAPLKLFDALKNPDVSTPELERIIGSDPALAAAVLGSAEVTHGPVTSKHFTFTTPSSG